MVKPRNPWDDEDVTPHSADQCACSHSRDLHDDQRCWACWIISPRIAAPAYPEHAFHLVFPFHLPSQVAVEAVDYRPERGWDRPACA